MQPPQGNIKNYQYFNALFFLIIYLIPKHCNNRYLYYKHVFRYIPDHLNKYDIAISYQDSTDMIDYYIAHKVKANRKISWVHFDVSKHEINGRLYEKLYKSFK